MACRKSQSPAAVQAKLRPRRNSGWRTQGNETLRELYDQEAIDYPWYVLVGKIDG